jgi:hypothetical protein
MTNVSGITVSTLYKKTNSYLLREFVRNHINLIDSRIIAAHNAGLNGVTYELPTTVAIGNMDLADAQMLAYSELIMIYRDPIPKGKGFRVRITLGPVSYLHIYWDASISPAEKARRQAVIKECQH